MGSTLVSATLESDNEQPSVEVNNSPFIKGAFSNVSGNTCTGLTFIAMNGEQETNLVAYSSVVNKTSSNTIILTFSGCFADSFIYTYTTPVTVVETPTPNADTPTPVPTSTFTPVPPTPTPTTCGGSNCADAAPEIRQCTPAWRTTPLAGGNDAIPEADFCNSGCLLTSLAMAARTTPPVLDSLFTQAGAYDDAGGLLVSDAAKALGWDLTQETTLTDEEVADELCVKQHVIVQISHPKTHYILVTGRVFDPITNRCRITINDPADQSKIFLDDPSYTTINKFMIFNTSPLGN